MITIQSTTKIPSRLSLSLPRVISSSQCKTPLPHNKPQRKASTSAWQSPSSPSSPTPPTSPSNSPASANFKANSSTAIAASLCNSSAARTISTPSASPCATCRIRPSLTPSSPGSRNSSASAPTSSTPSNRNPLSPKPLPPATSASTSISPSSNSGTPSIACSPSRKPASNPPPPSKFETRCNRAKLL